MKQSQAMRVKGWNSIKLHYGNVEIPMVFKHGEIGDTFQTTQFGLPHVNNGKYL